MWTAQTRTQTSVYFQKPELFARLPLFQTSFTSPTAAQAHQRSTSTMSVSRTVSRFAPTSMHNWDQLDLVKQRCPAGWGCLGGHSSTSLWFVCVGARRGICQSHDGDLFRLSLICACVRLRWAISQRPADNHTLLFCTQRETILSECPCSPSPANEPVLCIAGWLILCFKDNCLSDLWQCYSVCLIVELV